MNLLELLAARATLAVVQGAASLWRHCGPCGAVRPRWHVHPTSGVVMPMVRGSGRGGDVA